jgi:serine/threonine protein kinase
LNAGSKYIAGIDLAKRIKGSRLNYRDATELVASVAEALHYAHKQGLVHRDGMPGNILIDGDGKPFVVDFGLTLREENIGKEAQQERLRARSGERRVERAGKGAQGATVHGWRILIQSPGESETASGKRGPTRHVWPNNYRFGNAQFLPPVAAYR